MKKIVGIVTIYYPDVKSIVDNINSYLNELDYLILWENTPIADSEISRIEALLDAENIIIRGTGQNEGLAKPFNECMRWAEDNGYDYLLTMDQDSYFANDDFRRYVDLVQNNTDTSIAIFAANRHFLPAGKDHFVEIRTAISSGAIYPVEIFGMTGAFLTDLFVYMVDIEFCFRAKRAGMKIVCVPSVNLEHQEGYVRKSIFGLSLNYYSAQSTYYIIRNTILIWKLYPEYTTKQDKSSFFKYKIAYRLLKLIFEDEVFFKFKAIFCGLLHGIQSKKGKYDINPHKK
jgi:rhamnosyltransferase